MSSTAERLRELIRRCRSEPLFEIPIQSTLVALADEVEELEAALDRASTAASVLLLHGTGNPSANTGQAYGYIEATFTEDSAVYVWFDSLVKKRRVALKETNK